MNWNEQNVLLTGATGGIGAATATLLAQRGARLWLVARNDGDLQNVARGLGPERVRGLPADLTRAEDRARICDQAFADAPVTMLINNAGVSSFENFVDADPERIEAMLRLNLLAPMQLVRSLLPGMLKRGRGHIVNVGSTFGSIGFAHFATYSATKFGLRGFSEALRRELAETPIDVTYVAPRATRTTAVDPYLDMAQAVKMAMDPPERVAEVLVRAIERRRRNVSIGVMESIAARVNSVFPRLLDSALRGQNRKAAAFCRAPA